MRVDVAAADTADHAGEIAAALVMRLVPPDGGRLGVATGSSPLPTYRALAESRWVPRRLRLFLLDEYLGIEPRDPRSYEATIRHEVVDRLGLPDAVVDSPRTHRSTFDDVIAAAGGIDVQLLGIGRNGHIGFNEPGKSFRDGTRAVTLADETRIDNARFFSHIDDVPTHAITQGIATILRARHIVLIAFGEAKRQPLIAALLGEQTPAVPASSLQRHRGMTVITDPETSAHIQHHSEPMTSFDGTRRSSVHATMTASD